MNAIYEQLKRDATYAQKSYSKELLYQTHGAAGMARKLNAISHNEYMEIVDMTVRFMNTDREYLNHQRDFFRLMRTGR